MNGERTMNCELCQQPLEASQTAYCVTPLTGRVLPGSELFKLDANEVRDLNHLREDGVWCERCYTILHNAMNALFAAAHAGGGASD
jgi:hypothetical protein